MSNALWVAWRVPCPGLRASSVLPSVTLRPLTRDLRITPPWRLCDTIVRRPFGSLSPLSQTRPRPAAPRFIPQWPAPVTLPRRSKKTSTTPDPEASPSEPSAWEKSFSAREIKVIFGRTRISKALGNRVLAELQSRRLSGTLDLDLPTDITRAVPQAQIDTALEWLRANYPIDEDEAILRRIERDEREEEEKLLRRAEKLGLYKPQSGAYDAELGDKNDIYGKSVLKEAREQNEKRLLEEQERKRREWLEGEHQERDQLQRQLQENTELQKYQESALTEARPRADPAQRPYLAWVQKHHIAAVPNQPESMTLTTPQRLLAPLIFTLLILGLCYVFAQNYEPPPRQDRLWPNMPPAVATVGTIIGANVAITLLWKFPPMWKFLNRFFVIVPMYPNALSIVGGVFSHQTWRHLSTNMIVLGIMGTRVHDEIGRGDFLATYFASGVVGSMLSLTKFVLLGQLGMASLGASAAISGIVAAWCTYHYNDWLTSWILPSEWQNTISVQGWVFLSCLVATEIFSMVTPARFLRIWPLSRLTKMDHVAHLGGYVTGAGCGYALLQRKREEQRKKKAGEAGWTSLFR